MVMDFGMVKKLWAKASMLLIRVETGLDYCAKMGTLQGKKRRLLIL